MVKLEHPAQDVNALPPTDVGAVSVTVVPVS